MHRRGLMMALVLAVVVTVPLAALLWSTWMPGSPEARVGPLPDLRERLLARQLHSDVVALADGVGQRNMRTPGSMEASVGWIAGRLAGAGHAPERQTYRIRGGRFAGARVSNVIAEVPGTSRADEIVVLGAHYDTVPGSPGANDNASGVAVMLALAATFQDRPQARTLRFVAFANEEHPFFRTRDMGSQAYVRALQEAGDDVRAAISLDGVGYFSDAPGSQHYPMAPIAWFYPDRGDFIGFITRSRDAPLVRRAIGEFRHSGRIPSHGAALPEWVPGVTRSDHRSFWDGGFPAFLVTDTLPFRDPQYHRPGDTADRLDYLAMARVTLGLERSLEALANL